MSGSSTRTASGWIRAGTMGWSGAFRGSSKRPLDATRTGNRATSRFIRSTTIGSSSRAGGMPCTGFVGRGRRSSRRRRFPASRLPTVRWHGG